MCGLTGVAGRISAREEKLFKHLLILDSLRGEDSTGVAAVAMDEEVLIAKQLGDPFQLFDTSMFNLIMRTNNRVLIGHNRFATQGKVNRRNAHPFETHNLVGAHNGTLSNKWNLKNGNKFDVDSEALLNDIDELGVDKAIGSAKGAWALVWWDKLHCQLNFLRNKERPLFYVYSEDKKNMFWCSEKWMLTAVLGRDQYKHGDIQEFKENTLYTFDIDLEAFNNMKEIGKPRCRIVEGGKEVAVVQQQAPKSQRSVIQLPGTSAATVKSYLGSRDVIFDAVAIQTDKHGQDYMLLCDRLHPEYDVRLYLNKSDYLRESVGKRIRGNIASLGFDNAKEYFKVSPWLADVIGTIPKDTKGNELNEEEFLKKYGTCSYCTQSISYMDDCYIFDDHGGILCKDCITVDEITKFVRM